MKRLLGGALAAGVLIFGGANAALDDDTGRDDSGQITESGELGVLRIRVGDCLNIPAESGELSSVEGVTCAEAHDGEAFHAFQLAGEDFPGREQIDLAIYDNCVPVFESFVGHDFQTSVFDIRSISPTEQSWNLEDDREVTCAIVMMDDSKILGTTRGSAR